MMAQPVFPSYAMFVLDGYAISAGGGVQRDEMDDGYIAQVPKASLSRYEIPVTYRLATRDDKDLFETWRRETLGNGARWFTWTDVADRTTLRRARLVDGAVEYRPAHRRIAGDWFASMTIEYWA